MHITRIELENIKSHVASTFDFERGTTAITGPNGAGKTTLIEAVAWTLFDLLDYKKEDFLRRGAKKGSVRVTFESSLDERLYTVYRDTGTGYNVYDPSLKTRVADKREEVCRFLWQHLGVEPGTDLDSLFRRAIGVPQGTFTTVFLETPAERKKAFDKLLKVEEYRRGAEELLKTARFIDQQIIIVRERIARAEGEIARIDAVEDEHRVVEREARELTGSIEKAKLDADQKTKTVEVLDHAESRLNEARAARDRCRAEQANLAIATARKESELHASRDAAKKLAESKADYERHASALLRLAELERERTTRDKLRDEISKIESALAAVKADQRYTREALEAALKAHAEISGLRIAAAEQDRLEAELNRLRDARAHSKAIADQITRVDEKLSRLRESYRGNKSQLGEAIEKTKGADGLEALQKRDDEIVRELASLHAALERDERFQREIRNGLCPILTQKCLNLKDGQTLEDFVSSQFTELRTRIAVLETEHGQVAVALKTSREAERYLTQLSTLQEREKEIAEEGTRLNEEKDTLTAQLADLPKIEAELEAVEIELKKLDNPKGKIQLLEAESSREGELRQKLSKIESNLERLESDRRIHVEQTETYKDLDTQWSESAATRDATAEANRIYLANEALAARLGDHEREYAEAIAAKQQVDDALTKTEAEFEAAVSEYDRNQHLTERAALLELQKRHAELTAKLDAARKREADLAAELARLNEIRSSMAAEFREKERLEKTAELTTFIRDTLKEAAPLVARNYVYHVSAEANVMFREITGNAEHTLKWGEDYGITLEEDGYDRPFQSLSGGEQMAAALSVRLALLKQLTDIRIAFFDEPTTNMDAERRENLAQQLGGLIRHFDQLFVISHDDTFEGYVDNVVTVERADGQPSIQLALGEAS